jgi:hypothetical protein
MSMKNLWVSKCKKWHKNYNYIYFIWMMCLLYLWYLDVKYTWFTF